MEEVQQLFTKLIAASILSDEAKQEWLGRLAVEGPSETLLNELEAAINDALVQKQNSLTEELQQIVHDADKVEQEFNQGLKGLGVHAAKEQKEHDMGLIAAIRAKLGL
jgi:hypothetical protein